jgi:hypothetical protein
MPVFDADNPSAFIYNMQMTVQNADSINLSVNPAGTVTVDQLNTVVSVINANIGDLSDLTTEDKTSLVNAVNEVKAYTGTIQSLVIDAIYPIGSLYMSINNTMPSALAEGKTWELLSGNYVLKTISSGTGGQTSNAGNTGSTTLTAAQSGVPAHSHGLNSHTHSIPALSGSAAYNGEHSHSIIIQGTIRKAAALNGDNTESYSLAGTLSNGSNDLAALAAGGHTHTVTTNESTTGTASGSTANNSATNASQGHTHTAGMPQNIGVYVWKRIA